MASDQVPNLLLYDDESSGTVLIVTALMHPDEPTDFMKRPVRLNIAGVAAPGDQAGQKSLVAVAVLALRDALPLRKLVSYGRAGVTPQRDQWTTFVSGAVRELAGEPRTEGDLQRRVRGPDTSGFRKNVASDLATLCNAGGLREYTGKALVVRSGTLGPADFIRLKPWRIISDTAAEANPEEFDPGVGTMLREALDYAGKGVNRLREVGVPVPRFTVPFAVLVVAVITVVFLWPSAPSSTSSSQQIKPTSSTPSPRRSPSPSPSPSVSTTPATVAPTQPAWQLVGSYPISDGSAKSTELTGLVAIDPSDAIAVGVACPSACIAATSARQPLVEVWNGSKWKARDLPVSAVGPPIALTAAASSRSDEWVFDSTGKHSYAFRWTGSGWEPKPLPDSAAIVYAAVAFSANDVWAFATLPDGSFYVAHYGDSGWTAVAVDASYAPLATSGALSVSYGGAIWITATVPGSTSAAAPQYELLRWVGDAFQRQLNLPKKPLALAVLAPDDIWLAASDGMWNWNGSQWVQVPNAPAAAALASNGSAVGWLAAGKLFSSDGSPSSLQVDNVDSSSAQPVAIAWVPGAGGHSLWAVFSLAQQSGQTRPGLAEMEHYSLTS